MVNVRLYNSPHDTCTHMATGGSSKMLITTYQKHSFAGQVFIYLWGHLTALSVAQAAYRRMVGRLVNNELERIRKEAVTA
jgi:hypothetical protein